MNIFYTPDVTSDTYTLNEEESRHCVRVLRLSAGDKIQLIDGKGGLYDAQITDANAKRCSVSVIDIKKEFGKKDWNLHIAIAPTKNMDRLEWFVEKSTEIGIDEISLINCDNSERNAVKTERLTKVAISAIKQSIKAYLPKINELENFKKCIENTKDFDGIKLIAHCYEPILPGWEQGLDADGNFQKARKWQLGGYFLPEDNTNLFILIGPEGDFSPDEVKFAMANGFKEVALGNSRLRTETAGVYACAVVNNWNLF